jgi:protein-S-isoprenylcysteine O-methyltransferase Ste14
MEDRRLYVFTVIQILAVGVLFWFIFTWKTPWNLQRYLGTVLCVAGAIGIAVARYQLGKSFSIRAQAKQLVTHGLYSKIRNPIYVFGVVMFAGFILVLQRPVLWVLLVVIIVGQTVRAHREARVLEASFGDEYREYRRNTWF